MRCQTVLLLGLAMLESVGCGAGTQTRDATDGPPVDAAVGGVDRQDAEAVDRVQFGDGSSNRADVSDFGIGCNPLTRVVLSDPTVVSGTVAASQTAMVRVTMSDQDPNGYVSYPGAVLSSPTNGVTIPNSQAGPAGSLIDSTMSRPLTWSVAFDASVSSGSEVDFSARVFGMGQFNCPNAFVLSFSLTAN